MGHAVMLAAEESEVVETGGSAVGPMHDVMGIAPSVRAVAPGMGAAAVPSDQCPANRCGDGSVGPPDVEHRVSVSSDLRDRGIARDATSGLRSDDRALAELARLAWVPAQDTRGHREHDLRPEAAGGRGVPVRQMIGA